MKLLLVLFCLPVTMQAQSFKDYLPSIVFTALAGSSDGLRDASMFRMDGYSSYWNGKNSWTNKYKGHDKNAGPAYFGSTSFLSFTTDGAHLSNMMTHQFSGMAMAYMPPDDNRKLSHIFLKVLAYNAVRQLGHTIVYDVVFKPRK